MGLSIYLHANCHAIDDESWEAAYLTSLQLLQRFPGPLAARVWEDVGQFHRLVVTKNIVRDVGSPEERWEIDRELGSGRFAESFTLYRHLEHYRTSVEKWGGTAPHAADDILRPEAGAGGGEPDWCGVGGYLVFDSKTQGYPYHYAVLAVGMLLESCFPRHVLLRGDITRRQAEQTAAWASAVLGRPLPLPLVVDGRRLWQRVNETLSGPEQIDRAIARFGTLLVGDYEAMLRGLTEARADPQAVRRAFRGQLFQYDSLSQRGSAALIRAVCNVDGDLTRAIDWACTPRDAAADRDSASGPTRACFQPEELLSMLCHSCITMPLHERELLALLQSRTESLANIEEMFGRIMLMMSGMPEVIDWYLGEERLLFEFVRRWPERERELRQALEDSLEETRRLREQLRQVTEQLEELGDESAGSEPAVEASHDAEDFEPTAAFIRAEIERQREDIVDLEDAVRLLGRKMQAALRKNHDLRRVLEGNDVGETLDRLYQASFHNGIELPEDIWRRIDGLQDLRLLHALLLLMSSPEQEIRFWRTRQQVLESPDLWPLLT